MGKVPTKTSVLFTGEFAKLVKKCAFEMNAEDKIEISKAHDEGREFLGRGVAGGPSFRGRDICIQTARGMNMEPLGEPVYYLLAYVWNDILDWADRVVGDDAKSIKDAVRGTDHGTG